VDENQLLGVEDLNVKGMVRRKASARNYYLGKSISDASWSEFLCQLRYKGQRYGCQVISIDRFYPSSKRCHHCSIIKQALKLSERVWTCDICGTKHDRDLNAALNIISAAAAGTIESYAGEKGKLNFQLAQPFIKPRIRSYRLKADSMFTRKTLALF
jgi:putative transposase